MADYKISETLKRFIQQRIHSVEEVEVLIQLQKDRNSEWTADRLSQIMKSSTASIEKRLADLLASELVERVQHEQKIYYRYGPKTPALAEQADELVRIYPELKFRIIQLIFEGPIGRIRDFADAFKLKEDRDDT